jgi:hypothetical protein
MMLGTVLPEDGKKEKPSLTKVDEAFLRGSTAMLLLKSLAQKKKRRPRKNPGRYLNQYSQ